MGYCRVPDCNRPTEGTTGLCSSHNKALRDVVKAPIAKATTKRKGQMDEYHERAKEFIKGKKCAVYPTLKAQEVHHMAGRSGEMLLDEKYWLPVSRKGHVMIEMKPEWAKKMGYSVSRITSKGKEYESGRFDGQNKVLRIKQPTI